MTRLAAMAVLALLGALVGGFLINIFNDDAHPQGWIPVLGYLVLALLLVFAGAVAIGLARLVRRTLRHAPRVQ